MHSAALCPLLPILRRDGPPCSLPVVPVYAGYPDKTMAIVAYRLRPDTDSMSRVLVMCKSMVRMHIHDVHIVYQDGLNVNTYNLQIAHFKVYKVHNFMTYASAE